MMNPRNLVLFIATSLDGYIATEDHNLDWLFAVEGEGDNGYSKFYDSIDTILLGRITYDWIMKNEKSGWPYKDKECYVFSRTKKDDHNDVTFIHEDAVQFTKNLKTQSGKDIWIVGGGELLSAFMKESLVDELIISVTPVLLGKGIPLFKDNDFQTPLTLISVDRFNQFVELHYRLRR